MNEEIPTEVTAVVGWIEGAALPAEAKNTLAWCFKQLPALAQDFTRTYESRYADEALRLEQGMLRTLAGGASPELATALIERLQNLNEQLGLPGFDLHPRVVPEPLARKKRKPVASVKKPKPVASRMKDAAEEPDEADEDDN